MKKIIRNTLALFLTALTLQGSGQCANSAPIFTTTSSSNFTLGCGSMSVGVISIINAQTNPPGGPVSYTILPPGSSAILPPTGTLSSISTISVSTSGF